MRGRKPSEIKGIERYDFDKLARTEGNARERRRYVAFAHIREGKTFTETAAIALMNWVKQFRTKGLEGLYIAPH